MQGTESKHEKTIVFLFISNEKEKIKKPILFIIASKRITLRNKPNQIGLVHCNYKTLLKEIKEEANIQKDTLCSWIGKLNVVKMSILPKVACRYDAIFIKIPMPFFTNREKLILKFILNCKGLLCLSLFLLL